MTSQEKTDVAEAVEVMRRAFCTLQSYSFLKGSDDNVRRVPERSGNWVDWQQVHELFDMERVDWLLAQSRTAAALKKASGDAP